MLQQKVLIVEDEVHARTGLTELVSSWGYRARGAADGREGLDQMVAWQPAIVVTDLKMPRMDGMELLRRIGDLPERYCVVMLTLGQMVGSSPEMKAVFALVERVASSNVSVLVTGESGTGKELVARALHDLSGRRNKPFVAVNCAAIPETLIESEIFGHEKGAFTGAQERRAGCFELAEEGTLLLDEIGEMPAGTQAKLLRVLEDRKVRRLGSKAETPVDVRVIAATNRNPQEAVAAGQLRADLYYRLNVFNIQMPPLRSHVSDIPSIAEQMIGDMNEKHGCRVSGLTGDLMDRLLEYRWPGNVRELRNTIERAVVLAGEGDLGVKHLPPGFGEAAPVYGTTGSSTTAVHVEVGTTVDEAERQLIVKTLSSMHNNKTRAAEILGISTKTLQNKLKEYARD
jgi:DNA-binding NtrC family response regulator